MNILWIIPLSVRKGFYLDKKLFIRNHLKLAKSGSSESRSSFQRSEGGVQYSTKFSDGPRNSQVVSVPSLWTLTCGGSCSEHKSLVCPGSLGLAGASAGAQPHARPGLWGRSGACKGERANSPEGNRETESESDMYSGVLSKHTNTKARKHFIPGV